MTIEFDSMVPWRLPDVDYEMDFGGFTGRQRDMLEMLEGSGLGKAIKCFLYKYTQNIPERNKHFLHDLDLWGLSRGFVNNRCAMAEGVLNDNEDGSFYDGHGHYGLDIRQRRLYLYLLLKCKYSHNQCLAILDHYEKTTGLDNKLPGYGCGDWRKTAGLMAYSGKGAEPFMTDFISDVMVHVKDCYIPEYPEWKINGDCIMT